MNKNNFITTILTTWARAVIARRAKPDTAIHHWHQPIDQNLFMYGINKWITKSGFALLAVTGSIFLTSCSTHLKRTDGPPHFYVDETKIPNAKPRAEKLSKRGNMRSYVVFGQRYYVMRSSKNYSATGIASWYGTMFHARNTSSGEPYNMLSMTAAHKTLPLPTYVEVTNLKNHRKIIVKVNDRGPFRSNRLIDLSYVAAKKLNMLGKGTAHVRVTAIDPYRYGKPIFLAKRHSYHQPNMTSSWRIVRRTPAPPSASVYLQVGAFKSRTNARRLRTRLMALLKMNVLITPPLVNSPYFCVKIGPFKSIADADELTARLKHLGIAANRIYGA